MRSSGNRSASVDLLDAATAWFAPMEIDDDLAELIDDLERYSLTPSRVFRRETGWTESTDHRRVLRIAGRPHGQTYRVTSTRHATVLNEPGDYHGTFTLEKLRFEHEYRWLGEDSACLGDVPIDVLVGLVEAALVVLESGGTTDILAALPRTRETWGRLGTIRALRRDAQPDGGTAIQVEVRIEPGRIQDEFPEFSRYLDEFLRSAEMELQIRDESGATWMRLDLRELSSEIEVRVLEGALTPLAGGDRMLPTDLYMDVDLSTAVGPFRVGFRGLRLHLRFERSDDRIALSFLAGREPEWRIPFVVKPLMTGALRRPFEGDGLESRTVFVRDERGRTLVNSDFRLEIKETWLLRRLGGSFGSEFDQDVERERREFWEDAVRGLREDLFGSADPSRQH